MTEITKEEWIKARKENTITMEMCYEFYLAKDKTNIIKEFNTFKACFSLFQSYLRNFNNVVEYFDQKFNINILRSKTEEIIKIY